MIRILPGTTPDQLEIDLSGHVSQTDYEQVLMPAIEAALGQSDALRMLIVLGDSFKGFEMGAVWADTKMGLSHWRGFDRIAIATDVAWVRVGARGMAPLFPCPMQVFSAAETDEARVWLRSSLGSIHLTELGGTAIQLQLLGKLDPAAFAKAGETLSAHVLDHGGLRLLLDVREFDGWQGLSALGAHLGVARTHAGQADRIALVGNKRWQKLAERAAGAILSAETRFFDAAEHDAAKVWLTAG